MSVKDDVQREANSASEKLRQAKDEAARQAQDLAGKAQETASQYVDEGKQAAAGHLTTFASAVRKASDELAQNDEGLAARFVTEAADGLEKVANSISGASVEEMVSSVTTFARRNPAAFVIGSVLAGIALGRFAKASAERSHGYGEMPRPVGTGSGQYGQTADYRGSGYRPGGVTGSGAMNYPGATRGTTYPAGNRPTQGGGMGGARGGEGGPSGMGGGTGGTGGSSGVTGGAGSMGGSTGTGSSGGMGGSSGTGTGGTGGGQNTPRVGPASTTPTNR